MKLFNYVDQNGEPKIVKIVGHSLLFLLIIIPLGWSSWGTVGAGERGVKLRMSAVSGLVNEGFFFKVPYLESVQKMNVQVQKDEVEASAASKDLQTVSSKMAINFKLSPEYVTTIYRNVGTDYKSRIIDPAVQESVKAVMAKYTAEELITKRELVRDEIKTTLSGKTSSYGIVIAEVNITNFDFSKSFNDAIENKVTAEQSALAAKNKLEQIKFEAEQRVTQADGEARAIAIQTKAINEAGGAGYLQLKAIEKWNGNLPVQMIPNATVPFINLTK